MQPPLAKQSTNQTVRTANVDILQLRAMGQDASQGTAIRWCQGTSRTIA